MPGGIVLVPKGRIGSVTAPAFGDAVTAALAAAPRVVIDLSEIDYLSGAGIGALQQAGERVVVCGLHDAVRIALELSGVLSRIVFMETRVEALESLITHRDH